MTALIPTSSAAVAGTLGADARTSLAVPTGWAEISVFEDGVPPRFRLHFSDAQRYPHAPLAAESVVLETVRPDGARQSFGFREDMGYLESVEEIPEPHEFTVELTVQHEGSAHKGSVRFTEQAHGHPHHGGHEHGGHGHVHSEGSGFLGWLKGLYGHSHDASERVDAAMESNERGIWALKVSLVGLGITAAFQLVIVLISGSVALLADTIHNFADAGTSLPLWFAFALARRGANRRFTYGHGKIEDVAGVLIILIIFFSACVAAYESVIKLIHPQPMTHLGWVTAAAIVGFLGNEAVAVFRIRIGREIGSAALIADGLHARVDGFTSLAVLIGVGGVLLGAPILDPLVGIGITIAILFIVKDAVLSIGLRLLDGIEPDILAEIEHAPLHVPGVREVREVRARWIGHRVYSDIAIAVDPKLSVSDGEAIAEEVRRSLRNHVRLLDSVVVRVCPAVTAGTASPSHLRRLR